MAARSKSERPGRIRSRRVPCEFEGCPERAPIEDFDESAWLPVFKLTREHMGFFCPAHVAELRQGKHARHYVLTRAGQDELVIDLTPMDPARLTPPGAAREEMRGL
jgi:hypothetical protein